MINKLRVNIMNITELTKKVREKAASRTIQKTIRLLQKSHIIDKDGYYSDQFFSEKTVANDRSTSHSIKT